LARHRAFGAVSAATARVAEHHICELLSFCVQTHGYRIKYYMLRNGVVHAVLGLLERREKHLVLDAIRFMRTCVGIKDEFYNRFFVRNNLFKGIFAVFVRNGPRNNLLNSSIIELLEFIRSENVKMLVSYVVNNFSQVFEQINYVETYRQLLATHQNNERSRVQQGGGASSGTGTDGLAVPPGTTGSSVADSGSSDGGTGNPGGGSLTGPRRPTSRTSRSVFGERRAMADDDDDSYFNDDSDDDEDSGPKPNKNDDVTSMSFEEHLRLQAAAEANEDETNKVDEAAGTKTDAQLNGSMESAVRGTDSAAGVPADEGMSNDTSGSSNKPKPSQPPAAVADLVDVPVAVRTYAQAPAGGRPPTPALPPRVTNDADEEAGNATQDSSSPFVDPPRLIQSSSRNEPAGVHDDGCVTPMRPKRPGAPTSSAADSHGGDSTRAKDTKRPRQENELVEGDVAMT
jgi:hypothetical protein